MIQVKSKCVSKCETDHGCEICLEPIASEEGERYFNGLPHGVIKLSPVAPAEAEQFEVNAEYYIGIYRTKL